MSDAEELGSTREEAHRTWLQLSPAERELVLYLLEDAANEGTALSRVRPLLESGASVEEMCGELGIPTEDVLPKHESREVDMEELKRLDAELARRLSLPEPDAESDPDSVPD
jgi:hypothetical protein